jgi:hypothetical protein
LQGWGKNLEKYFIFYEKVFVQKKKAAVIAASTPASKNPAKTPKKPSI